MNTSSDNNIKGTFQDVPRAKKLRWKKPVLKKLDLKETMGFGGTVSDANGSPSTKS